MNRVEIQAAELLLDKGVRVELRAPFLLRWFGKKTFSLVVKRPMAGTMARISRRYLMLGIDASKLDQGDIGEAHELLSKHLKPVSMILAIGIIRGWISGWMFARPLAFYLRWNMDALEMAKMAVLLIQLSGIQHFTNTIRFLMMLRITKPKNLSPKEKGSQKAE